jgi:hypothetical protein
MGETEKPSLPPEALAPVRLEYETLPPSSPPPIWVSVVAGVYVLLLISAVGVTFVMAKDDWSALFWAVLLYAALFTGGGLLVIVPVRARRRRPVGKRSIYLPMAGAAILAGLLCFGIATASAELWRWDQGFHLEVFGLLWLVWAAFFWLLTYSLDPVSMSARLYKLVLAGSVVELLVAVPMHLIVRKRTECCAGMMTGFAICVGVLTALVAIGPGIFFLFYRRWKDKYAG